jgi:hypothetical protein
MVVERPGLFLRYKIEQESLLVRLAEKRERCMDFGNRYLVTLYVWQ